MWVGGWGWEYGFDIRKSLGLQSEHRGLIHQPGNSLKVGFRLSLIQPLSLCYPVLVTPYLFLVLLKAII